MTQSRTDELGLTQAGNNSVDGVEVQPPPPCSAPSFLFPPPLPGTTVAQLLTPFPVSCQASQQSVHTSLSAHCSATALSLCCRATLTNCPSLFVFVPCISFKQISSYTFPLYFTQTCSSLFCHVPLILLSHLSLCVCCANCAVVLFPLLSLQRGLKNVFDEAILAALEPPETQRKRKCCIF